MIVIDNRMSCLLLDTSYSIVDHLRHIRKLNALNEGCVCTCMQLTMATINTGKCLHVCVYMYMYVCIYIYIYMCVCVCVYVCMCGYAKHV